jgi:hypothetical protein
MAKRTQGNARGVALIVALLILLVLTLMGLSLINTATFEAFISGNERVRTEAFYAAEAGLQESISKLPSTDRIPYKQMKGGPSYWTGTARDKSNPAELERMGLAYHYGGDLSDFGYKRYRIRVTGEQSGSTRELEAQVKWGQTVRPSTEY